MSTVLWVNALIDGKVRSDEADKYALYRHAAKLDRISRRCGVTPFRDTHDTTDAQFNLGDTELPRGMHSTDELMAQQGNWTDAREAVAMLEAILQAVRDEGTRFGLLHDDHDAVVAELVDSLAFARQTAEESGRFNFAVVM